MRATGDHSWPGGVIRLYLYTLSRLSGDLAPGPCTLSCKIAGPGTWAVDHAEDRFAVFSQADIDAELTVAANELLGAIEWVNQPQLWPLQAIFNIDALGFLRQNRDIGCQGLKPLNDDLMSTLIRRGDRRTIGLVGNLVFFPVNIENHITRCCCNIDDLCQQRMMIHYPCPSFSATR